MTDKSLPVKLGNVSLLEHNLSQQISHFCSFTLHAKLTLMKGLVHLRLNLS